MTVTADPGEIPDLLLKVEPHLILLDLMLPGTNGIELMEVVRAMVGAPIIFLSTYGDDHVIARGFEKGSGRLHRQALLAHRACRENPCCPEKAGPARAGPTRRSLRHRRPGHRLRPRQGDRCRSPG